MTATRGAAVLRARLSDARGAAAASTPPPDAVVNAVARFYQLEQLPMNYVLPDPALLPDESIRFFYIDPDWMQALVAGVLSVSAAGSNGQAFVARHLSDTIASVRWVLSGGAPLAPVITGFLLRSRLVSAYPHLEVRAFAAGMPQDGDPNSSQASQLRIPLLRLHLLATGLLLALFYGVPASVWIEEPHHGLRVGINPPDIQSTVPYITPKPAGGIVPVPFRDANSRVIDATVLAARLAAAGSAVGAGALGNSLLRLPIRQVFTG